MVEYWRNMQFFMLRLIGRRAYSQTRQTIGFIGLGAMGRHMSANLLKNTTADLIVLDAVPEAALAVQALDASRTRIATTPKEIAEQADIVVTMLPNSSHVEEVYLGENGLIHGIQRGGVYCIDSSTIAPAVSKKVAEAMRSVKCVTVDAPVSGGVQGAEAGTLTFMVGAETPQDFDHVSQTLNKMGKNIVHLGKTGSGQVMKLANNMLLAITMIGTSEAMTLALKHGLDSKVVANIINTSTGRSWSSEINNPCPGIVPTAPASRDYNGGFRADLIAKDLRLAMESAQEVDATVVLGNAAKEVYGVVQDAEGCKGKDFSVVFRWLGGEDAL
jgi:3-hydroxyisobutyrate dehydrogenase